MLWKRKRPLQDFQEEIRSHLELEAEELRDRGVDPSEAGSAARVAFGSVAYTEERYYERMRNMFWDRTWQDVRYAVRVLYRSPVFSIAAIATLALGIGANTTIFSVVRAVLLKPLPYAHPERIVALETLQKNTGRRGANVSAPDFHDYHASRIFEYLAYHSGGEASVISGKAPSFVNAQAVTAEFFAVFGLPPAAGRFWSADEDRKTVAVLGHEWAQSQFGTASNALGKTLRVYGKAFEVIGVAAPGFRFPDTAAIWVPAGLFPENPHRSSHNYMAIGRLKAGSSLRAADGLVRSLGDRLSQRYPDSRNKSAAVVSLTEKLVQPAKTTLWVLLGAVFCVLLIACANVANLQLSRAASRSREMALRVALGAGQGRIVRQVLTESMVLGICGAALGLGLGSILLDLLVAMAPADIPRLNEVRIDGYVLLFSLLLAMMCGLLFGMAPARRSSDPALNSGMRQTGTRGSIGSMSGTMRTMLVGAEVATSVVLLAGAGLLLRSFVALNNVDLGFTTQRMLVTETSIPASNNEEALRAAEFQRVLLERVGALPGVRRAAGVRTLPLTKARLSTMAYWIDDDLEYRPGVTPSAQGQVITPGYFQTLGIPVLRGRDFSGADALGRPQVAIINETLARRSFGTADPIGHTIRCGMSAQSSKGMEIVGIVRDTRQAAPGEPPRPELFLPYQQHPRAGTNLSLLVQTSLEPAALTGSIREIAKRLDPDVPVRFTTMDEIFSESLAYPRFRTILIGCFGLVAALLAVIGVYSVISYVVSQRASEIGLRFALGARSSDVFRLVIGESMRPVVWGLAAGLVVMLALSRVLRSFLFGVGPYDPLSLAGSIAVLGVAALLGSSIPALRAARVDPVVALRQE